MNDKNPYAAPPSDYVSGRSKLEDTALYCVGIIHGSIVAHAVWLILYK